MDHDDFERKAAKDYARESSETIGEVQSLWREAFLAGCSYARAQQSSEKPTKVALYFDSPPEHGYSESLDPYPRICLDVPTEDLQKQLKIGGLIAVNYSKWPLPTFYSGIVKFTIQVLDYRLDGLVRIKAAPVLPKDEFTAILRATINGAAHSAKDKLRNAPRAAAASADRARQSSQNESAEFSDEEIMSMMPEGLRRDLANLIERAFPGPEAGFARAILNAGIVEHCRDVLAAERAKRSTRN